MLALRYFTFCLHVPRKPHDISSLYPRKIRAKKSRDFRNSTLLSVTDHNISLRVLYIVIILSRQWTTKTLIRLHECAGWSASLLFAYSIRQVFTWCGSYVNMLRYKANSNFKLLFCIIWATSWENLFMPYANNKGADQPAHPRSLIGTFVARYWDCIIPILPISKIWRC